MSPNSEGYQPSSTQLQAALDRAVVRYFEHCQAQIPAFVTQHFRYPGALRTNRGAFGWDILRAPLNLFWAPVYALVSMLRFLLRKSGRADWADKLAGVPAGLTTQVQEQISRLIVDELLQGEEGRQDLSYFLAEELRLLYQQETGTVLDTQAFHHLVEPRLAEAVSQYQVTRTATADITNTLSCTVVGAFAFQKFTPGGIGIGLVAAGLFSNWLAARDFLLGETLGRFYYDLFPVEPGAGDIAISMLVVMGALSAFAALSGVITDPIQARLGLHQYRLRKMLSQLQQDITERSQNRFRPKDQYLARMMDLFDMVKSSLL